MGFNVACSPGQEAAAAYMRIAENQPSLVIYLDPVNVVLQLPPLPGGDLVLARFCRELAQEAIKLADAVDPARNRTAGPRHLLADEEGARDV